LAFADRLNVGAFFTLTAALEILALMLIHA
jgi:hypothetical protein